MDYSDVQNALLTVILVYLSIDAKYAIWDTSLILLNYSVHLVKVTVFNALTLDVVNVNKAITLTIVLLPVLNVRLLFHIVVDAIQLTIVKHAKLASCLRMVNLTARHVDI